MNYYPLIKRIMETKNEIAKTAYNILNKAFEGISDYTFHGIIKQTEEYVIIKVSYTWSIYGWKKPVNNIQCILYKEDGACRYILDKPILAKDSDFVREELARMRNAKNQPGVRSDYAATLLRAICNKAPRYR